MVEENSRKENALSFLADLTVSFGETERPQYVQDLPIRLNVWRAFAVDPGKQHGLLITPNNRISIAVAVAELREAFDRAEHSGASLIALNNMMWTQTTMEQFFSAILPSTYWFNKIIQGNRLRKWKQSFDRVKIASGLEEMQNAFREAPEKPLWRLLAGWSVIKYSHEKKGEDVWVRLEGACSALLDLTRAENQLHLGTRRLPKDEIRTRINDLLEKVSSEIGELEKFADKSPVPSIWAADLNRHVELASSVSRKTVKVDAAERVFEGTARKIRWAVIDSGIDATHPAFADGEMDRLCEIPLDRSRVVATYDFNRLKLLFSGSYGNLVPEAVRERLDKLHNPAARKNPRSLDDAILMQLFQLNAPRVPSGLSKRPLQESLDDETFRYQVREYIEDVKRKITDGEVIDWALLEPLLRMPHEDEYYVKPQSGHGTHVAGTIAGNLRAGAMPDPHNDDLNAEDEIGFPKRAIQGMCPDMRLYDLRVCDEHGGGDEFLVVAALQFINYFNRTQDRVAIHGANLSLQIQHMVRNYGCGQTPVCREANNLVANGVVVVAAAGNRGFNKVQTDNGPVDTYSWSSITDPGNAEEVITVGSTHRENPFSYGVSYFSSRGPTGDGRSKPDLVAPGEKIVGPLPNGTVGDDTGTSMAAPHVSGAAALLLARYPELVGNPTKVKKVLCNSATDLGRHREFQGAGLVDVLRALQSL